MAESKGAMKFTIAHAIAFILMMIFGALLWCIKIANNYGDQMRGIHDQITTNAVLNRKIGRKVDSLSDKMEVERESEEKQLGGIDRRLSRVEGHLRMRDGDP